MNQQSNISLKKRQRRSVVPSPHVNTLCIAAENHLLTPTNQTNTQTATQKEVKSAISSRTRNNATASLSLGLSQINAISQ